MIGTQARYTTPNVEPSLPRLPEHLQRRDGVYHFRMRVPDDLRAKIGKREFRRSLGTSNLAEARRLVAMQRFRANAELEAARRSLDEAPPIEQSSTREFTDDDLWSLMACWFQQKQKEDIGLGIEDVRPDERLEELTYATDPNDTNFPSGVRFTTMKFLAQQGITLDPAGDAFRRLCKLIHEAWIERERRLIRRFIGSGSVQLNPRFDGLNATSELHPGAKITLAQLMSRFEADKAKAADAPKTRLKRLAQFKLFAEVLGADIPLSQIGRDQARALFDVVARMPANATKRFPKLGITQLMELPSSELGKPVASHTANAYLSGFAALMEFGVNEHLVVKNPAKGLQVTSDGVKAQDQRLPFTNHDLTSIFSAPLYIGCLDDEQGYAQTGPSRPRRGRFWVPLVALFSGLRLNEVCQLTSADVCVVAGHDVILIRPSDDGTKRLKTAAANRVMPIHPELKRLGFLTYVEDTKRSGQHDRRLFPELRVASTGYVSDNFSKWFARFLDHVGVDHPKKNFHSFRHNFRDALRRTDVPIERVRLLGGWSHTGSDGSNGSDARYGNSPDVIAAILSPEIEKVAYPGLCLEHLRP